MNKEKLYVDTRYLVMVYVLFSSELLTRCEEIHADGTFKVIIIKVTATK